MASAINTQPSGAKSTSPVWVARYGYFRKFESLVFQGIFLVAYTVKWGVRVRGVRASELACVCACADCTLSRARWPAPVH